MKDSFHAATIIVVGYYQIISSASSTLRLAAESSRQAGTPHDGTSGKAMETRKAVGDRR